MGESKGSGKGKSESHLRERTPECPLLDDQRNKDRSTQQNLVNANGAGGPNGEQKSQDQGVKLMNGWTKKTPAQKSNEKQKEDEDEGEQKRLKVENDVLREVLAKASERAQNEALKAALETLVKHKP